MDRLSRQRTRGPHQRSPTEDTAWVSPRHRRSHQLVALHSVSCASAFGAVVAEHACAHVIEARAPRSGRTWREVIEDAVPGRVGPSLRSHSQGLCAEVARDLAPLEDKVAARITSIRAQVAARAHAGDSAVPLRSTRGRRGRARRRSGVTARHGVGAAAGERRVAGDPRGRGRPAGGGVALARAAYPEGGVVSRSGTRPSRRVVAGFGGDLISHAYVEQELLPAAGGMSRDRLAAFERQLDPLVAPGVALARTRVFGSHGPGRRGGAAAAPARSRSAGPDTAPIGPVRIDIRLGRLAHDVAVVDPGENRVARRRNARPCRPLVMGDGQQRPIAPDRRLHAHVDSSWPGVRLRDPDRESERSGRAVVAGQRGRPCERPAPDRCAPASLSSDAHAARVCNSLGDGVLAGAPATRISIDAGRFNAPCGGNPRSGTHGRLSHSLSAVRRSARRGAGLARALSRCVHDRGADSSGGQGPRARIVGGTAGDLAPGARRLQGRRPRSHRLQRPALLAAACATGRAAARAGRGGPRRAARRSPRNPRRRDSVASRTTTSASNNSARSTSASSSTNRARAGPRLRCRARRSNARPPAASIRRDRSRNSWFAAPCRRWSKAGRPIRSSSCACSIPPWAAARFSWRPASSSPINARRR